jgi:excisionase family DNA binding protein
MPKSAWGFGADTVMDWRVKAACRDALDPDAWMVTTAAPSDANLDALRTCRGCPVQRACLAWYETLPPIMRQSVIAGGVRWDHNGQPHRVARSAPQPDMVLSTVEAATYLFVTPQTVNHMCKDGRIKAVRNEKGHWRIRAEDLLEAVDA